MRQSSIKRWFIILGLVLLGACTPAPNETLPTLVRFPTEAPTVAEVAVVQSGMTLPATFTPTFTPSASPTLDPSVTTTLSPTVTVIPSPTITNTPTSTPTEPPTLRPEDRPILAFALTAAASTVLPPDYQVPNFGGADVTLIPASTPTLAPGVPSPIPPLPTTSGLPIASACSTSPTRGFLTLYQGNPDIANQLGCASGVVQTIPAAWQNFERGIMVWLNGEIIIFYAVSDTYQSVPDTFIEGSDPETTTETPPVGLLAPIRGFLKVWNGNSAVRNGLGWAITPENGTTASVQAFGNGRMIFVAGRPDVLILIGSQSGTWQAFIGSF